jgi:apolipoprotein N-acyltransferase
VLWNVKDVESQAKRFERMMDLSDRAVSQEPDLLVWPEASLPPLGLLNASNVVRRFNQLEAIIQEHGVWRVWGTDTWTNNMPFNSAVLIPPEDEFLHKLQEISWPSYAKRHLVMFGEYVPFSQQFPFLKKLAPAGNFGRGAGPVDFDLGVAKASVLICFEDVVPKLARRAANQEVDFLLNLTNDGWFGDSHQQWQHARTAAWRAIETRRPLVRCCNNGITGWVDEYGSYHEVNEPVHSEGERMVKVPIREGPHSLTFYQLTGDWLSWGAVFVCVVLALARTCGLGADEKNGSELEGDPAK